MPDRDIQVTPRPHLDGIDIDNLALVFLEIVNRLSVQQVEALAEAGNELLKKADQEVRPKRARGTAA